MSASSETVAAPRDKVHAVAKYQRFVILSLLFNIGFLVFSFLRAAGILTLPAALDSIISLVALAVVVFQIYSVVMLAKQFSHIAVAILAGVAMFLPLISLIVLLVYNQKATKFLQANGVNVGFLGVDPKTV